MRIRRWIGGLITAGLLAATLTMAAGWNPLCVLYDDGDAMWWILGCMFDAPPKDGSS